ncbi:MAG: hypothetical protein ACT4NP_10830, partial [Pseudonocardiales bacterium]
MHNEPTVLILTQPFDVTADGVVEELDRRGMARSVGLTVPPTLITNDTEAARRFAKEHDQIVYKPLSSAGVS